MLGRYIDILQILGSTKVEQKRGKRCLDKDISRVIWLTMHEPHRRTEEMAGIAGGSRSVGGDLGSRLPIDRGGDAIARSPRGHTPQARLDQRDKVSRIYG